MPANAAPLPTGSFITLEPQALGLDPVEIRRRNALHGGERTPTGSFIPLEPQAEPAPRVST